MGFFSSNKKKQEEIPLTTKPTVELTKCPICQQNTFQKIDYFYYTKDSSIKIKDTVVFTREKQDCKPQVGEDTGFCTNCGGIVRGLIFLQNTDSNKKSIEFIVAECNRAFIRTFLKIHSEFKSGKKEIQLNEIFDAYKTENKTVLDEWNMRTHLIIALHEVGVKFAPETNANLEELIQDYNKVLAIMKYIYSSPKASGSNNPNSDSINIFIRALAKYI